MKRSVAFCRIQQCFRERAWQSVRKATESWSFQPGRTEAVGTGLARTLLFTEGGQGVLAPSAVVLGCPRVPRSWGAGGAAGDLEAKGTARHFGNRFPFSLRSPGIQLSYVEGAWPHC